MVKEIMQAIEYEISSMVCTPSREEAYVSKNEDKEIKSTEIGNMVQHVESKVRNFERKNDNRVAKTNMYKITKRNRKEMLQKLTWEK